MKKRVEFRSVTFTEELHDKWLALKLPSLKLSDAISEANDDAVYSKHFTEITNEKSKNKICHLFTLEDRFTKRETDTIGFHDGSVFLLNLAESIFFFNVYYYCYFFD